MPSLSPSLFVQYAAAIIAGMRDHPVPSATPHSVAIVSLERR